MINQTEEYFEHFNLLREKLIGHRIKNIQCCMIELEEPENFQFTNIQGCEFGFDLTLDTDETIYLRIDQIGHTFGLTCGFETILNSLLKGPKLWDLTEKDFVSHILHKPIKNIEYSILRNLPNNDYRLDFIDKVEFILENERFIILAAEYLPEKDDFYLEADEATLIVSNETMRKYEKKIII